MSRCDCDVLECPNHQRCICAEWDGRGWSPRGNRCGVHPPDGNCAACGANTHENRECFGCLVRRENKEYKYALRDTPDMIRRDLEYTKMMNLQLTKRVDALSKQVKIKSEEEKQSGEKLHVVREAWKQAFSERHVPQYLRELGYELFGMYIELWAHEGKAGRLSKHNTIK